MAYAYTFLTGLLIGGLIGILAYRRNADKFKATEVKAKSLLDILKGR